MLAGCGGAQGGQNWPFRGGKCSAWQGGSKGIAFVRGPAVLPQRRIEPITHAVDWAPTVLSFAALPIPPAVDGVDLRPLLTSTTAQSVRTHLLIEADPYASPLDGPNWTGDQHATPYYSVRTQRFKLILGDPGQPGILNAWFCTGPPCPPTHNKAANASAAPLYNASSVLLFDLLADPYEALNVAAQHTAEVWQLRRLIEQYVSGAASSVQQGLPDDPLAQPSLHNGTVSPWR
jgi:arylsulfatase A-like enzyme